MGEYNNNYREDDTQKERFDITPLSLTQHMPVLHAKLIKL